MNADETSRLKRNQRFRSLNLFVATFCDKVCWRYAETMIDLRSDTVTRPTPAMRRAMAEAEVGDDTYGEDPTVRLLEEETAALLGKEAALFLPSGCMGNEIAVAVHTRPGDLIFLDRYSHIVTVE